MCASLWQEVISSGGLESQRDDFVVVVVKRNR
jgi:hypothetical protein